MADFNETILGKFRVSSLIQKGVPKAKFNGSEKKKTDKLQSYRVF